MFSVGEYVLYGINGVCFVEGITEKKVGKLTMEYYVLKPVDSKNSTLFVPTKNQQLLSKIRAVRSKDSVEEVLSNLPQIGGWNDNKIERTEEFKNIIASTDFVELIRMIRLIKARAAELIKTGRNLHMSDERILKDAEKMVSEEIALALDIDRQDAIELILK